jgi:hypothetical protein
MKDQERDPLRITNQFWSRHGMVYDLRGHGTHLTVVVSQRKNESDLGEWCAQARVGRADTEPLEQWGPTRVDAVRAVGRLWSESMPIGLNPLDWDAVIKLLAAVRAV